MLYLDPEQHCCQDSSDEEASPEDQGRRDPPTSAPGGQREPGGDATTSGYSSISSASPTNSVDGGPGGLPRSTSVLSHTQPCRHHARKSCLQCRSLSPRKSGRPQRQVKRKTLSTSSQEEEDMNLGFLQL